MSHFLEWKFVFFLLDKLSLLQKELDDVNMKLGDARVDKHEEARRKKKQEIVETFKSHFSGVVIIIIWLIIIEGPNNLIFTCSMIG